MSNQTPSARRALRLTESAVLLALATVLSLIKLIDLPYGGSVTAASLLPLLLVAYRYGCGWGCFAGFAYGLLQIVFSSSLSYVTGVWSVVAVVLLDFGFAFAAVGVAGVFRRMKHQAAALALGAVAVGTLRYACHVISGATVWAGVSIPTAAALAYSFAYNATYMLPETIILAAVAYTLGTSLDFRAELPARLPKTAVSGGWRVPTAALTLTAATVYDVIAIFPFLQDPETGDFVLTRLGEIAWLPVGIVTALALAVAVALSLLARVKR